MKITISLTLPLIQGSYAITGTLQDLGPLTIMPQMLQYAKISKSINNNNNLAAGMPDYWLKWSFSYVLSYNCMQYNQIVLDYFRNHKYHITIITINY